MALTRLHYRPVQSVIFAAQHVHRPRGVHEILQRHAAHLHGDPHGTCGGKRVVFGVIKHQLGL